MQRRRVSVLMTVYDADRYVEETLRSVLHQTFTDFEFVIVDDGSSDQSLSILNRYADGDPRIKIISRPNTGIVGALNDGFAAANGDYIARIDADDICEPTRFEKQVERLDADPSLVVVGCCARIIDEKGRILGEFDVPLTHEEIEDQHLLGNSSIHHPAAMIRRKALQAVAGYREGFCPAEDFDLWLRLGEIGQLANLPDHLIQKRQMIDGIVASTIERQEEVITRALNDAWHRRGLQGHPSPISSEVKSVADIVMQWGWMALKRGYVKTARIYAAKSLILRPWSGASWRLAFCAARGR